MSKVVQEGWKPEETCEDDKCPYHGSLSLRGRTFTGRVTGDRMRKTITVEWDTKKKYPKYERFARTTASIKAHNPPCIDAETGQTVKVAETRRLSKTKNFVVVEIIDEDTTIIESEEPSAVTEEKEGPEEKEPEESEDTEETKEDEDEKEVPPRSSVERMTKDEIKQYADDHWNVELSTNDLKDEMIDQLFEEIGDQE